MRITALCSVCYYQDTNVQHLQLRYRSNKYLYRLASHQKTHRRLQKTVYEFTTNILWLTLRSSVATELHVQQ